MEKGREERKVEEMREPYTVHYTQQGKGGTERANERKSGRKCERQMESKSEKHE